MKDILKVVENLLAMFLGNEKATQLLNSEEIIEPETAPSGVHDSYAMDFTEKKLFSIIYKIEQEYSSLILDACKDQDKIQDPPYGQSDRGKIILCARYHDITPILKQLLELYFKFRASIAFDSVTFHQGFRAEAQYGYLTVFHESFPEIIRTLESRHPLELPPDEVRRLRAQLDASGLKGKRIPNIHVR